MFQTARRTRSFVSGEAALLLQAVKQCKCQLRQLDRLARKLRLRELFYAWRGDGRAALSREGWSLSEVYKRTALYIAELDASTRKLRSRIRYDKGAYAARALETTQSSASPLLPNPFSVRCDALGLLESVS